METLQQIAETNNETLFPDESYDFWNGYAANATRFDRYFVNKYRSFRYFKLFSDSVTDSTILEDWKYTIDSFLFINQKRYSELYRVQVLASNAYDIVNNYDLTETSSSSGSTGGTENIGSREDSRTYGATTHTETSGAHTDTNTSGAATDTTTDSFGERTDSSSGTIGEQTSSSVSGIAGFNSTGFENDTNGTITNGARTDSGSNITGAQENTQTVSRGEKTDTVAYGEHVTTGTDAERTDTTTTGAQENTTSGTHSETTNLHRYGNIGVQTAAEIIGGHLELWDGFKFFDMIFREIAAEYLKITEEYEIDSATGSSGGSSGDLSTVLVRIAELSAKVDTQTAAIKSNDDSNTSEIRADIADISFDPSEIETAIANAKTAIMQNDNSNSAAVIANDNTNTTNIRSDITSLETTGF